MKISTLNIREKLISGEVEGLPSTNLGKRGEDIRKLRELVHNYITSHYNTSHSSTFCLSSLRRVQYGKCVSQDSGWIVTIHLRFPNGADKDIDNQIKPILDGLTLPTNPNQFVAALEKFQAPAATPLNSLLKDDKQIIAIHCTKSVVVDPNSAGFSFSMILP
jgi:hypothetical protein